jgi:hypothetical protein
VRNDYADKVTPVNDEGNGRSGTEHPGSGTSGAEHVARSDGFPESGEEPGGDVIPPLRLGSSAA